MRKSFPVLLLVFSITMALNSCSPQREVRRIDSDEQIDLSGRWNDTDSRMVAEALTDQVLNGQWLENYKQNHHGARPILIVGLVRNKSHEHINAETFIKDIEKAVIKDGSARLVQAGDKRDELRAERADQQDFASSKTAKQWGQELGADFMLQGTINSIVDSYRNEKVVNYQVNLELANLETNEIVWIGDKKIRKYINN
ncbi:MAG: penicillin-binding protein activator LpoB [Bacteroidales bacterium]|nr:penicillin-binding protein activator LpoB [Bacteroidales bacterium]MBS3776052.1 penicillin-binding protein activator LpoB [Bacteroidales bacterium]